MFELKNVSNEERHRKVLEMFEIRKPYENLK
jgi:hypothetical protein